VSPTSGYPLSRTELAEAVNEYVGERTGREYVALDARAVGRYERGEVRWPQGIYREALRKILRIETDAELGFWWTPRGLAGKKASNDIHVDASVAPSNKSAVPDLTSGEILSRFARIRQDMVESDNIFGPEQIIPAVLGQIKIMQDLHGRWNGHAKADLLILQAKFGELAAWLHQDYGNHVKAEAWLRNSLNWGRDAGDHELTTYATARCSQLAGDSGDGVRAVKMGTIARQMSPSRSRLAALAETYAAHGYALQGDSDRAEDAYNSAHRLLDRAADSDSEWCIWLDHFYIDISRHRSFTVLGLFHRAAAGFDQAIQSLPNGYHRDRGVYLARAARAYAGANDVEYAADLGMRALAIGNETRSGRILSEVLQLSDDLQLVGSRSTEAFQQALAASVASSS
jgi:tetratricopeptide (TPR) repeat protein